MTYRIHFLTELFSEMESSRLSIPQFGWYVLQDFVHCYQKLALIYELLHTLFPHCTY
jgi:hypothetical protein